MPRWPDPTIEEPDRPPGGWQFPRFRQRSAAWLGGLVDLVIPPACLWCGTDTEWAAAPFCNDCLCRLCPDLPAMCGRCAMPLPPQGEGGCPACAMRRRRWPIDSVTCLGYYDGTLRQAVLRMKRLVHLPLARGLGRLLAERIASSVASFDAVVPVPMHWTRRWRGVADRCQVLAEQVGRVLDVPVVPILTAVRRVGKQGTLSVAERFGNVRGAFEVDTTYDINGLRLLVIDDVMTTGATATAMATAARRAGAAATSLAVVARAVDRPIATHPDSPPAGLTRSTIESHADHV